MAKRKKAKKKPVKKLSLAVLFAQLTPTARRAFLVKQVEKRGCRVIC